MALVLAVEPDHRQASILKRIIRDKVRADLVLVDSRDAAVAALTARIPDVILLTALLSPRDEEELVTYLRTLAGAQHIQTHTIPQLASTAADMEQKGGGGLFGKLLGKKDSGPEGDDGRLRSGSLRRRNPDVHRNRDRAEVRIGRSAAAAGGAPRVPVATGTVVLGSTGTVVLGSTGTVVLGSRPGRPSLGGGAAARTSPRRTGRQQRRFRVGVAIRMAALHCAGQRRCGFGHAVARHQRPPGGTRRRSGRAGPAGAKRAAGPRRGGRAAPARGGSRGRAAARGGSRTRARGRRGASP